MCQLKIVGNVYFCTNMKLVGLGASRSQSDYGRNLTVLDKSCFPQGNSRFLESLKRARKFVRRRRELHYYYNTINKLNKEISRKYFQRRFRFTGVYFGFILPSAEKCLKKLGNYTHTVLRRTLSEEFYMLFVYLAQTELLLSIVSCKPCPSECRQNRRTKPTFAIVEAVHPFWGLMLHGTNCVTSICQLVSSRVTMRTFSLIVRASFLFLKRFLLDVSPNTIRFIV